MTAVHRRTPTTFICVICIDDLWPATEDDYILTTPCCHHVFHMKCLDRWLRTVRVAGSSAGGTCPNCHQPVTVDQCRRLDFAAEHTDLGLLGQRLRQELAETNAELEEMRKLNEALRNRIDLLASLPWESADTATVMVNGSSILIMAVRQPTPFSGTIWHTTRTFTFRQCGSQILAIEHNVSTTTTTTTTAPVSTTVAMNVDNSQNSPTEPESEAPAPPACPEIPRRGRGRPRGSGRAPAPARPDVPKRGRGRPRGSTEAVALAKLAGEPVARKRRTSK